MSDLHGEAALFHAMLEKIHFSKADSLYILGDVIDRGPDGIKLLQEIMNSPNITMLLGNHEYMMMQYYHPDATAIEILRWNRNGNLPTKNRFQILDPSEQERIMAYLGSIPTHLEITVNSQCFYLVHAFPGENVHDEVWVRPEKDTPNPIEGTTLIIGHTPVLHMLGPKEERDGYKRDLINRGEHPTILHADGFIDIDCGCSYEEPLKTLGCLRLDDMAEFYVHKKPAPTLGKLGRVQFSV